MRGVAGGEVEVEEAEFDDGDEAEFDGEEAVGIAVMIDSVDDGDDADGGGRLLHSKTSMRLPSIILPMLWLEDVESKIFLKILSKPS